MWWHRSNVQMGKNIFFPFDSNLKNYDARFWREYCHVANNMCIVWGVRGCYNCFLVMILTSMQSS